MPPMLLRLLVVAALSAVAAPAAADFKQASPQAVACHDEATQRYIADFQQVGMPKNGFDGFPVVVTAFENQRPRYEEYFAECIARWDRKKVP